MKSNITFNLPPELIAQKPVSPRDRARLLVYNSVDGSITDNYFYKLDDFLAKGTTLVLNNSKVEHCRWLFAGGKLEVFVIEKSDASTVRALVRPGKKFRAGTTIQLTDWLIATVMAVDGDGIRTLSLSAPHSDKRLKRYEHVPLPPYIEQNDALASEYQTVYAKPLGSMAAPTAGLHFTDELLTNLKKRHQVEELTLHVGLGTFANLTNENLKTGKLHQERYQISDQTMKNLKAAKHITAVGTTTVRALETAFGKKSGAGGSTDIFIRPGYYFKAVDSIITNFHLPGTSLLLLVAAFIADKRGSNEKEALDELLRIYEHAIKQRYRFYSFGDAMLIV